LLYTTIYLCGTGFKASGFEIGTPRKKSPSLISGRAMTPKTERRNVSDSSRRFAIVIVLGAVFVDIKGVEGLLPKE
jgi:hypothetical protein